MIFLLEYDRHAGQLVNLARFPDALRPEAESSRLSLELRNFAASVSHEIVLLEAAAESHLRRSHRRYFEGLEELSRAASPTSSAL